MQIFLHNKYTQGITNKGLCVIWKMVHNVEGVCHSATCPFEHGEVINYTSDVVSIHQVTTKIQASFLTQLPERMDFTRRPMVILKVYFLPLFS